MLKPEVKQMLLIGQDCGLTTLGEAYENYMNHYDCFFSIEKFEEQMKEFIEDMVNLHFVTNEIPDEYVLNSTMTIEQCLKHISGGEIA